MCNIFIYTFESWPTKLCAVLVMMHFKLVMEIIVNHHKCFLHWMLKCVWEKLIYIFELKKKTQKYKLLVLYSIIHCGFSVQFCLLNFNKCARFWSSGPKQAWTELKKKFMKLNVLFIFFETFYLICGKKCTYDELERTRLYTGLVYNKYCVIWQVKTWICADRWRCVLLLQTGFTVDCKSALLAKKCSKSRSREREREWKREKRGKNYDCGCTLYEKQTIALSLSDMFLWICCEFTAFIRVFISFYCMCMFFLHHVILLKFGNVYGFHALPRMSLVFFIYNGFLVVIFLSSCGIVFVRSFHRNL